MTRQNDHVRAEELISAYLDNQVTAEEKQFFERHIASCADCHAQLEATRSMVAALRAMPAVKAPRSFVLPREMAKQPKRSVFAWYPALRLATVMAAIVFMIVFAGDLLTARSTRQPTSMSLPAVAPMNQALPREQALVVTPTPLPAGPQIEQALAPTAPALTAPAPAAAGGTTSADTSIQSATTVTETTTYSESTAGSAVLAATPLSTATPEATALAAVPPAVKRAAEATPESGPAAANQPAIPPAAQPVPLTAAEPTAPTIEPLRIIEIALLGLVIVLVVATLVARRKQA